MDDLSDFDEDDEDDLKEEGLGDQRQGRLAMKRTDANVDRRTLTSKSRRGNLSVSAPGVPEGR